MMCRARAQCTCNHGSSQSVTAQLCRCEMANLVCPLCVTPQFSSLAKLLHHIRVTHADANSFNIHCTLQGCCRTFTSFKSYQTHIYRYHNVSQSSCLQSTVSPVEEGNSDFGPAVTSDSEDLDTNASDSAMCDETVDLKAAATWILKIRVPSHSLLSNGLHYS